MENDDIVLIGDEASMTVISSPPAKPEMRSQPSSSLNPMQQDRSPDCFHDCSCVLTSRPKHQHHPEPPLPPFLDYKIRGSAPPCLGQCLNPNYGKIPKNDGAPLGYEPAPPCVPPSFWSMPQKSKKSRWTSTTVPPNYNSFAPPPPPPPVSQSLSISNPI
jgi:hypothetical protein